MNCPSDDTLRELLTLTRTNSAPAETVSHVSQCTTCRTRVHAWGQADKLEALLRPVDTVAEPPRPLPPPSPDAAETLHFQVVGNYELVRRIGRGGGGEVFEAVHTRLHRRVAVKLLADRLTGDQRARQRFLREMESIGRLNHPHIVQAHDAGEARGVLYLAMELIDGPDVESLARRVAQMPIPDACEIVRQAALGLQHVHEHGMVHRDLKPSNLLLSASGVKVADLGMALLNDSESPDERLTGSCVIMGTGDYMAPEQTEGARYLDIRSDLYSLGCTLYRLLAGHPPFALLGNGAVMKKLLTHAQQSVPDISTLRPDTPSELKAILDKLLAKQRDERYAEPSELAEALAPFCARANLVRLLATLSTEEDIINPGRLPPPARPTDPPTTKRLPVPGDLFPAPRRWSRRLTVAGVLLLLAWGATRFDWNLSGAASRSPADSLASNVGNSGSSASPDSTATPGQTPLRTVPVVVAPVKQPEQLGRTAQRWNREFGTLPRKLAWPGQSGLGDAGIDEVLNSLIIHTNDTVRFMQLGEIRPDDKVVLVGVDMLPQSQTGSCGLFLGYQADQDENPTFCDFQALHVQLISSDGLERRVLVRRYVAHLDGRTGKISTDNNCDMFLNIPHNPKSMRLELRFENNRLPMIKCCGQICIRLCNGQRNDMFLSSPNRGPFGVFVNDGTVWFTNPELKRNVP